MLEEMRHMTIMFSLFICERCLRNYSNPVAVVVEFNAPLSHKSCSRLQPSSIGPCPAMSQVTVSSLPTSVLHNSILLTLEHSSVRRAAALETGPLSPQDLKFGTVCCPISDCVECHMASSGSYWRQFYFDCEATAQCALFLSVPNRNIFTTYKLTMHWVHNCSCVFMAVTMDSVVAVEWTDEQQAMYRHASISHYHVAIQPDSTSKDLQSTCPRCPDYLPAQTNKWYRPGDKLRTTSIHCGLTKPLSQRHSCTIVTDKKFSTFVTEKATKTHCHRWHFRHDWNVSGIGPVLARCAANEMCANPTNVG